MRYFLPCFSKGAQTELEIIKVIDFYRRFSVDGSKIVIMNNSPTPILGDSLFYGATIINARNLCSDSPSLGEASMLENLCRIFPNEKFLKLHARCPVLNFSEFNRTIIGDKKFQVILRKNVFADIAHGRLASRCYVDTRVIYFDTGFALPLFEWVKERLTLREPLQIEHEVFNYVHLLNSWTELGFWRARPVMAGTSGHGRRYDSLSSYLAMKVVDLLSRGGLS